VIAYWTYHLICGSVPLTAPRRVFAAAAAGYVAINVAALIAAIELGIQPLLFHDASGTPLYAPYPLRIAIPAMLAGHLTIAGIAEAVISGGVVAYLQKSDPRLLELSVPGAARDVDQAQSVVVAVGWRPARALWAGVALLMIASPLGLLAAGIAWGEWGADDFQDAIARAEIAEASGDVVPPAVVPQGMARLASVWTAPMPDYAPPFMHQEAFGYIMSAVVGTGLILLAFLALSSLLRSGRAQRSL
jgi:cobalt/nickel transport system permease protein